jgi:hypothetical protein
VLGEEPLPGRPALVVFDSSSGGLRLACCRLAGVFRAGDPRPLPPAVLVRWPGLVRGTLRKEGLVMLLDPIVLRALVDDDPDAPLAAHEALR